MSYSRWSNSCWYTFNHVDDKFCVCGGSVDGEDLLFSLEELSTNLEDCLSQCYAWAGGRKPTKEEVEELKGYMLEYIEEN